MPAILSEITDFIIDTKHKTPKYTDQGYPCIRTPNIGRGYFILDNVKRVSEETYKEWVERLEPQAGDLILAREAPVGNVAIIPPGLKLCFGQRTVLIRPRCAVVDPRYLNYLLLSDDIQNLMNALASGATVPHLNMSDIRTLALPDLPPLAFQRKIVSILSAYDDLIDCNQRRIKILEEMAQALYREWFVNFRFPGHEKVRMVDSPLGQIPEEWKVVPFTEIAEVFGGGTPKTSNQEYWGGHIPFFAPKDSTDYFYVTHTQKTITELGLSKCNSKLYPKETVFITARGTVGKVVMAGEKMAINQSCYALCSKQGVSQYYLFFTTKEQSDYLKRNTGGATFDTIITDTFRRMNILHPKTEIINQFTILIQPVMELILSLISKNTILRSTRDLLLPKLISGEVDVSEIDIIEPCSSL